jgi:lysozyme
VCDDCYQKLKPHIDDIGIGFIKQWERFSSVVYLSATGDRIIGYGHRIEFNEHIASSITEQQAIELLRKDLVKFEDAAFNLIKVKLNQNQFNAFVSLVYNVGPENIKGTRLLELLNSYKFDLAMQYWKLFDRVGGKEIEDLKHRRLAEIELFNTPVKKG